LQYQNNDYIINNRNVGPVSQQMYDTLRAIQYGDIEDPFGWTTPLQNPEEKVLTV
jgi:branched-chain amino acid aminotransferase